MQNTGAKGERRDSHRTAAVAFTCAAIAIFALAGQASAQVGEGPQTVATYNPGQSAKVYGAIISRQGDDMVVRRENSNELSTVTLTEGTKLESPSGLLNIDRKRQDVTLLVPGLFVKVRGAGGPRGNLVAERISFHKTALKVANQISAGEVELRQRIAANAAANAANAGAIAANKDSIDAATARARDTLAALTARLSDFDTYDVKYTGTVNFASGSAKLDAAAMQTLDSLAMTASGVTGYLVEVVGHTDIVGTPRFNQKLSNQRTESVVSYLAEKKNVPLRRIVNPTGFGETHPKATNATHEGRAENRRVEVRVLVNRGLVPPSR